MPDPTVDVIFLNSDDGTRIASGNIPASQLPETFAKNTVMHINGQPWQVIQADPIESRDFIQSGKLTLTCAKVEYVSNNGILYALPTINDDIPATGDIAPEHNVFTLHEDDWRQLEFIADEQTDSINEDLQEIVSIYQNHQHEGGFSQIHVRKAIKHPLASRAITPATLESYLPTDIQTANAVVFAQDEHAITNVFAYNASPLVLYGHVAQDGTIDALCMQFVDIPTHTSPAIIEGIVNFMKDHNLLFIDWIRIQVIPPDAEGFLTYFNKFND